MKRYLLWLLVVFVLVCAALTRRREYTCVTAHVINMEESRDRLLEFQGAAGRAGLTVDRWPAVDGRQIQESDCFQLGIGKLIYRHTKAVKQPGVIGCFLSHRTLLNHLKTVRCDADDVHLIFEDDAILPADFWQKWATLCSDLPADWDIVKLGITYPNLRPVRGILHTSVKENGNSGSFAYAVRHRSLPKICKHLQYMTDPIDNQLAAKQNEWKIYIAWPEICPHNYAIESIIGH